MMRLTNYPYISYFPYLMKNNLGQLVMIFEYRPEPAYSGLGNGWFYGILHYDNYCDKVSYRPNYVHTKLKMI